MKLTETPLQGAVLLTSQPWLDKRGSFTRLFCAQAFADWGLLPTIAQVSMARNHERGTIRGMHYQVDPALEAKLIRCLAGSVLDVIVDLRPDSASYMHHLAIVLDSRSGDALYVPPLFAHGYQTLEPETELLYQMSGAYSPEYERGMRYDDPILGIRWPLPVSRISERDASWPQLATAGGPRA